MPAFEPSVLSAWISAIAEYLRHRGVDPTVAFVRAGLEPAAHMDPYARVPIGRTRALWRSVHTLTGDSACGIRVPKFMKPTTFHALGLAVFASNHLEDALQRMQRYGHVLSDAGVLALRPHGATTMAAALETEDNRADIADEAIDALISLLVRVGRIILGSEFALSEVHLRRAEPEHADVFRRFFGVPVHFGAAEDALFIPLRVMRHPLRQANPELAAVGDRQMRELLDRHSTRDFLVRVQRVVASMLDGECPAEGVARKLGMSTRTLQRRLQDAGSTYQEVVRSTREETSRSLLEDHSIAITEVAFRLGFASSSAFTRAFRSWTGESPTAYRQRGTAQIKRPA